MSAWLITGFLHPATYLVIYLTTIVGFAWLYDSREDAAFFAPYANRESISLEDHNTVQKNIQNSLNSVIRNAHRKHFFSIDPSIVAQFKITDDNFSFKLFLSDAYFGTQKYSDGYLSPVDVQVSRGETFEISSRMEETCRAISFPPAAPPELGKLFAQAPSEPPLLCWGRKAEVQFRNLADGWSGNAKTLSGSYWRMLYLSAVTITSVGYGDVA